MDEIEHWGFFLVTASCLSPYFQPNVTLPYRVIMMMPQDSTPNVSSIMSKEASYLRYIVVLSAH